MFNYKKEYKNSIKIINNYYLYLKHLKKQEKNINKFNELFISNIKIFKYKINNYVFDEKIYNYLDDCIKNDSYNIKFEKIVSYLDKYQEKEYIEYGKITSIKDIIVSIFINELSTMLDHEKDNVVLYNSRKEKKLICICNSLGNIINKPDEEYCNHINLCDRKLMKYIEFKGISQYDKQVYRNNIIKKSKKLKMTELDYLLSFENNGKYFGEQLIKKNNYFIINIITVFIITVIFISLNIYIKNYLLLLISILFFKFIYEIIIKFCKKEFIPELSVLKNEKLLCLYYKTVNNSDSLDKFFDELEILSKDNTYDYGLYIECTSCDHQIEPFDDEIVEKGLFLCEQLNNKYNTNRFHFIYRKRNRDLDINIWRGFDRFNGALKDIYDLIMNILSRDERDNLFASYTYKFIKYDYLMLFNNTCEYNDLINKFGVLLHPYNSDYKAITQGNNYYYDSLLKDSFIMRIEDIEYAKGTNGVIAKKSLAIKNKLYSLENEYKNNTRLLFSKRNLNKIEYCGVIYNCFSILFDITLLFGILLTLFNIVNDYYLLLFIILGFNYIYKLPINIYFKLKVIISSILSKKYKNDKLDLYMNNKVIYLYILYSIILLFIGLINKFNIIYLGILLLVTNIYIFSIIKNNRRYSND